MLLYVATSLYLIISLLRPVHPGVTGVNFLNLSVSELAQI